MQKQTKRLLVISLLTLLVLTSKSNVFGDGKGGSTSTTVKRITTLYNSLVSHNIESPKTVLAIVIYETGWLKCKSCALEQNNNLFGFRTNKDFLKFSNTNESIKYMKRWQVKYYKPWKARHPRGTYYEYLRYIRYCDNMDSYIRNIKSIEQWITENVETAKK